MTTNDDIAEQLARLERRDRRQVRTIIVLAVLAVAPWVVVAQLARSLDTRNDAVRALTVLVERQECTDRAEARWEDAVSRLVVSAAEGDEAGVAEAADVLERLDTLEEQIDRCPG